MKMKRILCLLLALGMLLSFAGCGEVVEQPEETEDEFVKAETTTIADLKLRDNDLLYKDHDPSEVVTMYLTVSTGNSSENTNHTWKEINTYSVYDYERMGVERYKVAGLLQIGDENGPVAGELGYGQLSSNCTVQIRGQTSSKAAQKNFKISIKDNKGEWNGQQTIALNKHIYEGLRFRNKMAYDLIAGIEEMMGLRTTFVHLYVKDTTEGGSGVFEDYGLYTQVEQLNKTALKAHGLDKNGHLYKINFFSFERNEDVIKLADDPTYDLKAFEALLEVKGDDDHSKLIEMLEAVNDTAISPDAFLDQYFDIENLAYWMAFHMLMSNTDTQNRNVYIYSPLNSDKWYFYSWDNDGALRRGEYELKGKSNATEWERGISNYWGNVLFQRALKSKRFRDAVDAAVEDLSVYLSPERINTMVAEYSAIVKPYVYSMPDVAHATLTEAEYDRIAASLITEIQSNYLAYKDSLLKPMPFYIGVPEKSEDGKTLNYIWDMSYDFDAETITYSFEIARDFYYQDIVYSEYDLSIPMTETPMLPEGQYFLRVKATNESGYSQYALDYYVTNSNKIYGTKCFYVTAEGEIVEDIYVEG